MPYTYKEALEASTNYFDGEELPAKVFVDKYALKNKDEEYLEKTPDDMFDRIAWEISRIEKQKFKEPMSFDEVRSCLEGFKRIIPQGSPMYGIGNTDKYITLSSCYLIEPPEDSYGGIHRSDQQLTQISKRRGGTGVDLSKLRPNGTPTSNSSHTSTGILPFLERFSNSIREVGQFGRRGALMVTLSVHHPEVLEFAIVKRQLTKATGANISIRLSDEFLNAVKEDKEYELRWPVDSKNPKISEMISAKKVWNTIIKSSWLSGEPGILFWDNILKESPADCYEKFGFKSQGTNPCSEVILNPLDSCRLLLLNLFSYVQNPFTIKSYFDYNAFYKDAQIAQRFMDDIVDLELECIERIINKIKTDPEPEDLKSEELTLWKKIKKMCELGRRSGTGITGLGDTIAALGLKYGSYKSIEVTEKIYKTLKLGCYRSSVDMAKELGPFPIFDKELEKDNPFLNRIKEEDPELYSDMQKYGRRNIALLTSSPAGSVSILTQTTSGIEPLFMMSYKRKKKINANDKDSRVDIVDAMGDQWQEFIVFHPKVKTWMEITGKTNLEESPWYGCCSNDINWKNRVKLQAVATKNVCHSISSTLNLPKEATVEQVAEIYETAWASGCKGITVYREGSRDGVLVKEDSDCIDCRRKKSIQKVHAPKRPKTLPCDIHHITVKGKQYLVLVGMMNKDPYEVFAGANGLISRTDKKGQIVKVKRGCYRLETESNKNIESIIDYETDEEEAMTRMISCGLRHGADIAFIVHQLEKTKGDLFSFAKSVARTLKKYIPEGTVVTGELCESCGGQLIRESGCRICRSCGWTACQ